MTGGKKYFQIKDFLDLTENMENYTYNENNTNKLKFVQK